MLLKEGIFMTIGERIRLVREDRDLSQRQLAEKTDINKSVLSRIESGDRAARDIEIVVIASCLNVSTDYLLGVNPESRYDNFSGEFNFKKWHELSKEEQENFRKQAEAFGFFQKERTFNIEDFLSEKHASKDYDPIMDIREFMINNNLQNVSLAAYKLSDWEQMDPWEAAEFKRDLYLKNLKESDGD